MIIKKTAFAFLLILIVMSACNSKKNELPNTAFREKVVSKITDRKDINKLDTLLTGLDKKGIPFCQFVQKIFQLDDSCYNIAKKKYPDPENEDDFVKFHLQATKEAELKYLTGLDLNVSLAAFATSVYNLDTNIKSFCDN